MKVAMRRSSVFFVSVLLEKVVCGALDSSEARASWIRYVLAALNER
jgi:hypothetical protein